MCWIALLVDGFGGKKIHFTNTLVGIGRTSHVGQDIFRVFVVPFEVVSMLLLPRPSSARLFSPGRTDVQLNEFLILSAVLFCTGIYGVLARRNGVLVLMSIELMLNAVNINLVAFSAFTKNVSGQVFALFIITIAAAEVGVGLAIVLLIYRNLHSPDLDEIDQLKG